MGQTVQFLVNNPRQCLFILDKEHNERQGEMYFNLEHLDAVDLHISTNPNFGSEYIYLTAKET